MSKYSGSEIKPILCPLATGFAIMFDTLIVQGNTNGGKLLIQPTKNGIQRCNHNDICKISSDIYIYIDRPNYTNGLMTIDRRWRTSPASQLTNVDKISLMIKHVHCMLTSTIDYSWLSIVDYLFHKNPFVFSWFLVYVAKEPPIFFSWWNPIKNHGLGVYRIPTSWTSGETRLSMNYSERFIA